MGDCCLLFSFAESEYSTRKYLCIIYCLVARTINRLVGLSEKFISGIKYSGGYVLPKNLRAMDAVVVVSSCSSLSARFSNPRQHAIC